MWNVPSTKLEMKGAKQREHCGKKARIEFIGKNTRAQDPRHMCESSAADGSESANKKLNIKSDSNKKMVSRKPASCYHA